MGKLSVKLSNIDRKLPRPSQRQIIFKDTDGHTGLCLDRVEYRLLDNNDVEICTRDYCRSTLRDACINEIKSFIKVHDEDKSVCFQIYYDKNCNEITRKEFLKQYKGLTK